MRTIDLKRSSARTEPLATNCAELQEMTLPAPILLHIRKANLAYLETNRDKLKAVCQPDGGSFQYSPPGQADAGGMQGDARSRGEANQPRKAGKSVRLIGGVS